MSNSIYPLNVLMPKACHKIENDPVPYAGSGCRFGHIGSNQERVHAVKPAASTILPKEGHGRTAECLLAVPWQAAKKRLSIKMGAKSRRIYGHLPGAQKTLSAKAAKKAPKDLQMPRNPHPCAINVRISSLYCGF